VAIVPIFVQTDNAKQKENPNLVGATMLFISILIFLGSFFVIISGVNLRLKLINQVLVFRISSPVVEKRFLLSMSSLHMQLGEIVAILSKVFAFPVVLYIGVNLLSTAFLFYDFYALFKLPDDDHHQLVYCIIATVLSFQFFAYTFGVIFCCDALKSEGRTSVGILQRKLVESRDLRVKKRLLGFLQQHEHLEVKISCGMFDIDWRVMFMVRKISKYFF
jgi:hypothetical protein